VPVRCREPPQRQLGAEEVHHVSVCILTAQQHLRALLHAGTTRRLVFGLGRQAHHLAEVILRQPRNPGLAIRARGPDAVEALDDEEGLVTQTRHLGVRHGPGSVTTP